MQRIEPDEPVQHLALIKKGLRQLVFDLSDCIDQVQHLALIKKGLRLFLIKHWERDHKISKLALIKKGLQNAKSPALTGLFFWGSRIGGKVLGGFFQFRLECEQQWLFVLLDPTTLN